MNPSYLYHAFGVRHQECTKTEYKVNKNIHYIQTRKENLCCPECKSRKIIRSGSTYRDIKSVPVGHRETILRMKVQRIECKSCGCIRQEKIHFVTGKRSYTNKFARFVVDLSRIGTIIIMTSNLTHDQLYGKAPILDGNGMVKPPIRPEFLNRIDEIIDFRQLSKSEIADVVRLQMKRVADMLEKQGFELRWTDDAIDNLAEAGYDPDFGARPVKRAIQRDVLNALSKALLAGKVSNQKPIIIDSYENKIVFKNE